MELVVAVVREIRANADILALLGSSSSYPSWVWREKPWEKVEGSQKSAIVISERGGWAAPNRHNTARFPRLQFEVFADPTRTAGGNPSTTEAGAKAKEIFYLLDRMFHLPQGGEVAWQGTRVVGSSRLEEPDVVPVPDGDGLVRLLVSYGVVLG